MEQIFILKNLAVEGHITLENSKSKTYFSFLLENGKAKLMSKHRCECYYISTNNCNLCTILGHCPTINHFKALCRYSHILKYPLVTQMNMALLAVSKKLFQMPLFLANQNPNKKIYTVYRFACPSLE